jgi:hypothetical protein
MRKTFLIKRIWIGGVAALALLGWAGSALAAPGYMPMVSVSPQSGPPGSTATVSGHTFTPGAGSILWDGAELTTLAIDTDGAFSVGITIPADAALGEHEVAACGGVDCAGDGAAEHAAATFTVTARGSTTFSPWLAAGIFLLALWFFWRAAGDTCCAPAFGLIISAHTRQSL